MIPVITAASVIVLLLVILILRTVLRRNIEQPLFPDSGGIDIFPDRTDEYAGKLSRCIRLKTVSWSDYSKVDLDEHRKFPDYIAAEFPLFSDNTERLISGDFGYCYKWSGSARDEEPGLLLAHFDVVPPGDEEWSCDPFGGEIRDGHVWGRGALDTKCTVVGILCAVEGLLRDNFVPDRDWYIFFGGDEETTGKEGAQRCTEQLRAMGITPGFLIDEGAMVVEGMLSGVKAPLALIGTSEKGYADISLTVEGKEGHASMPERETPVHILARALVRLKKRAPKARLNPAVKQFLLNTVPHSGFFQAFLLSNIWLFRPLILKVLSRGRRTSALIRTTRAPTMLQGSSKVNVLPARAEAVVNCRIIPGESVAACIGDMKRAVSDSRVRIDVAEWGDATEPVCCSDMEGRTFAAVESALKRIFPKALVTPYLATVTTDSRHFSSLVKNIYRVVPVKVDGEELERIHGKDERISFDNLNNIVRFYTLFIREMACPTVH